MGIDKGSLGVFTVLCDRNGKICLVKHRENGMWGLPGGGINHGENPADAALREIQEETGLFLKYVCFLNFIGAFSLEKSHGIVLLFQAEMSLDFTALISPIDKDEISDCRFFSYSEIIGMEKLGEIYPAQLGFIKWESMPKKGRPYFGNPIPPDEFENIIESSPLLRVKLFYDMYIIPIMRMVCPP